MLNINAECFDRTVISSVNKFAVHVLCISDCVATVVDSYHSITVEEAFIAFKERVDGFLMNSKSDLSDFDCFTEVEPGCNMAIFTVRHQTGVVYQLNFVELV